MSTSSADNGWADYLRQGERILWTGRPARRIFLFRWIDLALVPFSLAWAGFAFVAVWPSFVRGDLFFAAFGMLFLVAGAYATLGRFIHDAYERRHASYALTNERAFVLSNAWGRNLREQPLHPGLATSFRGTREGSVNFGESRNAAFQAGFGLWTGNDGAFAFRAIANPEEVYHIAQRAKEDRS